MVSWGANPLRNIYDTQVATGLSEIDSTHEKLLSSSGIIQVSDSTESTAKHAEYLDAAELLKIDRELVPLFEAVKRSEIGKCSCSC